jgi:hypothetical protein
MLNSHIYNSLFHIFIIVPLFLTVAFMRATTPIWLYWVLTVVGIVILIYHGYRLITRWQVGSPYVWVNAFHVLLIAPLLIFVGSQQKNGPRYGYEFLAMTGFAAFGYHIYSLIRELQAIDKAAI